MFKKFKTIAKAWITSAHHTPEEKLLAEERMAVCNKCEYRKKNTALVDFYYCQKCGCPLDKKIFTDVRLSAEDKCPEGKWEK
jgi:hypothetical protein